MREDAGEKDGAIQPTAGPVTQKRDFAQPLHIP